jgi:hypothetical protein
MFYLLEKKEPQTAAMGVLGFNALLLNHKVNTLG